MMGVKVNIEEDIIYSNIAIDASGYSRRGVDYSK
jgi:hypothetical protein